MAILINGVKCLKKGVKDSAGKYVPVFYSKTALIAGRTCVTIYARSCCDHLPVALGKIENETDMMTDYFDDDKVRFMDGTPEYSALLPLCR